MMMTFLAVLAVEKKERDQLWLLLALLHCECPRNTEKCYQWRGAGVAV